MAKKSTIFIAWKRKKIEIVIILESRAICGISKNSVIIPSNKSVFSRKNYAMILAKIVNAHSLFQKQFLLTEYFRYCYRCIISSIRLLKYISSTVFLNIWISRFSAQTTMLAQYLKKSGNFKFWGNTVEDMYFKSRILKIIHLYGSVAHF